MILLTKLFLAHLLGDFFLQPYSWVKDKEAKKLKSFKFYLHILIHIALLFLIVWDTSQWPLILIIGISHFVIDAIKLYAQKNEKSKRYWFFIDQFLHTTVIIVAYFIFTGQNFSIQEYLTEKNLLIVICVLFLTKPVSLIMKAIISKWKIEEFIDSDKSLQDAGSYIGILERMMVFIFVISGFWEAIGFLLAAKSVFRFGDLKKSKHRKLTEYILIGTLISFLIAIVTGLVYLTIFRNSLSN